MSIVSALFRNFLGKPGAADYRDSAEHFVSVMRETGIGLTWGKDELLFIDDLVERLKGAAEYRDAVGCYLGELLLRNFAELSPEWVPTHALGPAIRVQTKEKGARHLFPLGWVYRRADGGEAESIARRLNKELGYPPEVSALGKFTDAGERVWPPEPKKN